MDRQSLASRAAPPSRARQRTVTSRANVERWWREFSGQTRRLIRQGHDSGQAVPADAPACVPLSREVFEQDGVSRAEPPGGPIAYDDLHLTSGEENGVLTARSIVPIAEASVG